MPCENKAITKTYAESCQKTPMILPQSTNNKLSMKRKIQHFTIPGITKEVHLRNPHNWRFYLKEDYYIALDVVDGLASLQGKLECVR